MKQSPCVPIQRYQRQRASGLMVFWMRIVGAYCEKYCGASVLSDVLGEGDGMNEIVWSFCTKMSAFDGIFLKSCNENRLCLEKVVIVWKTGLLGGELNTL